MDNKPKIVYLSEIEPIKWEIPEAIFQDIPNVTNRTLSYRKHISNHPISLKIKIA